MTTFRVSLALSFVVTASAVLRAKKAFLTRRPLQEGYCSFQKKFNIDPTLRDRLTWCDNPANPLVSGLKWRAMPKGMLKNPVSSGDPIQPESGDPPGAIFHLLGLRS
jgi:hypothetical protein